jgi:hypothetical protein
MRKSYILSIIIVCLIAIPLRVFALPISGGGEHGGSFSGTLQYISGRSDGDILGSGSVPATNTAGGAVERLVINLTNTSRIRTLYLTAVSLSSPYIQAKEEVILDIGQSASITFYMTDRSVSGLTEESFLQRGSDFVVYFSDRSGSTQDSARVAAIPEPETILLLGFGLLAIGIVLRIRMR